MSIRVLRTRAQTSNCGLTLQLFLSHIVRQLMGPWRVSAAQIVCRTHRTLLSKPWVSHLSKHRALFGPRVTFWLLSPFSLVVWIGLNNTQMKELRKNKCLIPLSIQLEHVPASPSNSLWILQLSSSPSPSFIVYSSPSSDVSSWASSSPATPPCQHWHWRRSCWRCCCAGSQQETALAPGSPQALPRYWRRWRRRRLQAAPGRRQEARGLKFRLIPLRPHLLASPSLWWTGGWKHGIYGKIIEQTLMGECAISINTPGWKQSMCNTSGRSKETQHGAFSGGIILFVGA